MLTGSVLVAMTPPAPKLLENGVSVTDTHTHRGGTAEMMTTDKPRCQMTSIAQLAPPSPGDKDFQGEEGTVRQIVEMAAWLEAVSVFY